MTTNVVGASGVSPMGEEIIGTTVPEINLPSDPELISTYKLPDHAERSRQLRRLLWSWLPGEPQGVDSADTPSPAELQRVALGLLGYVTEARRVLELWEPRLLQVAKDNGASNPEVAAALGVGKEAVRRRLLREPDLLRGAAKKVADGC